MKGTRAHSDQEETVRLVTRTPTAAVVLAAVLLASTFAAPARAAMPAPDGTLAPELVEAFQHHLLDVPDHSGLTTTSSSADWLVPMILVNFADSTLKYDAAALQSAIFDTTQATPTGSLVDYYNWVSAGRLRVRGEVAATVTLPHPEDWYTSSAYGLNSISTPHNDWGLVNDAITRADSSVDWNRYDRDGDGFVDMLWIVHAGLGAEANGNRSSLWSLTTAMAGQWSNGGNVETHDLIPGASNRFVRINRFSMLPELSPFHPGSLTEIGVYCHEFGHALGLPDLYDTSALGGAGNVGPGNWSLMATGGWGGDGRSPQYPAHPGAWCMLYLGLATKVQPVQDTTVVLAPLSSGGPVFEYSFQGASNPEHFLLEQRYRQGFDRNLPADGVIITQVDDAVIGVGLSSNRVNAGPRPGMRVLEADADFDLARGAGRGDANDPIPGATNTTMLSDDTQPPLHMLDGSPTNLWIDGVEPRGTATRLRLHVRAAGWYAVEDFTEPQFAPTMGFSRGHHAAINANGDEYEVFSDSRFGTSQVMLRSRAFQGMWRPAQMVSSSAGGAYDPTIATLPEDGLAVAWSDRRDGAPQIYYRCRIHGAWSQEARLSLTQGGTPAIAADNLGHVHVCWTDGGPPRPRLQFLTFAAGTPGGTPLVVTDSLSIPSAPSIAASPTGGAWIFWPDFATGNYVVNFARYSPDSGMIGRLPLTRTSSRAQPSVDIATDAGGNLHVVWQQIGVGASELHYQRRVGPTVPMPIDTTILSSAESVQNPSLCTDRTGNLHLVFERYTPQGQMVRYKRWRLGVGWDFGPTDISDASLGSAGRVNVLALTPGNVSVLYTSQRAGVTQLRTRRRRLDPMPLAVEAAALPRPSVLRVGPSPLRPGREVVVSGSELALAVSVDLFDAAGRRVATTTAGAGSARFTPGQTRLLEPGLYFARVRGGSSQRLVVIR